MSNYKVFLDYFQNYTTVDLQKGIIESDDLEPLLRELKDENYFNPSIPRILLCGQFKAGKSTFLNALLKGDYAATDILEMTSWVARYWPNDNEFCRISYNDHIEEMSPEDFIKKCNNRDFTDQQLKLIERVDIGVNNKNMQYSIIDTPGFGSTTRENEKRLILALKEADIVAWILSVEDIGNIKEAAFIDELIKNKTPLVCILTKCDVLDCDEEYDEIVEYIKENNLKGDNRNISFFKSSALNCLEEEKEAVEEFDVIQDYFLNSIVTENIEYRQKANSAHEKRLNEYINKLLDTIDEKLNNLQNAKKSFDSTVQHIMRVTQTETKQLVVKYVSDTMFEPYKNDIITAINNNRHKLKNNEQLELVITSNLPQNYIIDYSNKLLNYTFDNISKSWGDNLENSRKELTAISDSFNDSGIFSMSENIPIEKLKQDTQAMTNEIFKTGLLTTAGIAAGATTLVTATTAVTAGAAISGIGFPIAVMGSLVAGGLYLFNKNKNNNCEQADYGMDIIDNMIEHYITKIVKTNLYKMIDNINKEISEKKIDEYTRKEGFILPENNLEVLIQKNKKYKGKVNRIEDLID